MAGGTGGGNNLQFYQQNHYWIENIAAEGETPHYVLKGMLRGYYADYLGGGNVMYFPLFINLNLLVVNERNYNEIQTRKK